MRLLRHKGDDHAPGEWKPVNRAEIAAWREKVKHKLATAPRGSVSYQYDTGVRKDIEQADSARGDEATFSGPRSPSGIREARDTIDVLAAQTLEWVRSAGSKDVLRQRVAHLQRAGGMSHLSLDEAVDQVHALALKLAQMDAERVYNQDGHNRPVLIVSGNGDA